MEASGVCDTQLNRNLCFDPSRENAWTSNGLLFKMARKAGSSLIDTSTRHKELHYWELHCMAEALREAERKTLKQEWVIAKLNLLMKCQEHDMVALLKELESAKGATEGVPLSIKTSRNGMQDWETVHQVALEVQEAEGKSNRLEALLKEANTKLELIELGKAAMEQQVSFLQGAVATAEQKRMDVSRQLEDKEQKEKSLQSLLDEERRKHSAQTRNITTPQHKKEVEYLIREKNFAWDQMKRMEETYAGRLKAKGEQLQVARQEIDKLRQGLQDMQNVKEKTSLETSVLRVELKKSEDEVHQLKAKITGLGLGATLPEVGVETAETTPGVNRVNDRSQGTPPVQLAQSPRTTNEDLRKRMEELRRENENWRLLYGELEASLQERQKQARAAPTVHKDTANRNLHAELEAVAAESVVFKQDAAMAGRRKCANRRKRKANSSGLPTGPLQDVAPTLNIPRPRGTKPRKRLRDGGSPKKPEAPALLAKENDLPSGSPLITTSLETERNFTKIRKPGADRKGCKSSSTSMSKGKSRHAAPPWSSNNSITPSQSRQFTQGLEVPLPALLSISVEPTRSTEVSRPSKTRFFSSAFSIPKLTTK